MRPLEEIIKINQEAQDKFDQTEVGLELKRLRVEIADQQTTIKELTETVEDLTQALKALETYTEQNLMG